MGCGTMKALEKHLEKFKGDPAHKAQVTERPASPPRPQRDVYPADIDEELLTQLGGAAGFGGIGGIGAGDRNSFNYPRAGASFDDRRAMPPERGPRPSGGGDVELGCICGYSCGTKAALQRHLDRFAGNSAHARK